jgi:SAM-dependent methyltransferase
MSVTRPFQYAGSELADFRKAVNWKRYWSAEIAPYLHGDVLEVGAGIGANTSVLAGFGRGSYTSVEPDAALAERIRVAPARHRKITGTLEDVRGRFDAILYIDVLEHIEDDRAELVRAAARLKPDGHVIVLSPAHPLLYSRFDKAIGHFRRYTRASLAASAAEAVTDNLLAPVKMIYLDSAGLLASVASRVLSQAKPSGWQVLVWDRVLVPISRVLDPLLGHAAGKSVLGVWKRVY